VNQIIIPSQCTPDKLIWKHNSSGELSMKDAYEFKRVKSPKKSWAKIIWCKDIPPSKSLLVWRLMLDKVPTDDKLMERGCCLPSMCSLCNSTVESTFHLFFTCRFAFSIWCWLAIVLNLTLHFQNIEDIWNLCERSWSPSAK
jgi:hypothetical protein